LEERDFTTISQRINYRKLGTDAKSTEALFDGTSPQKNFLCKNCAIVKRIAPNGLDSQKTLIGWHNYSTFLAQFCPTFVPVLSQFWYIHWDNCTDFESDYVLELVLRSEFAFSNR
jgi:hypothetical protein